MDEKRQNQIEALEVMYDYNKKLTAGIAKIILELRGNRKEDTAEYLNTILNGINWVMQVAAATEELINEKEKIFDRKDVNVTVMSINQAYTMGDDARMAELLEKNIVPLINALSGAAMVIAGINEN